MTTAVQWDRTSVHIGDSSSILSIVDAQVVAGELCVVAGPTSAGKSTLLRTINGAVPHAGQADLAGRVHTLGRDIADHPPRRLSDVVSTVPVRPSDGFIASTVEDEVGYGLGRLHLTPALRSRRIEEALARFAIGELRTRPLTALSAGQQRRVALASALAAEPDVLVLDEPVNGLDAFGAAALGRALQAMTRSAGTAVVLAEQRLEQVLEYSDSVLYLPGAQPARYGEPRLVLAEAEVAPPIVELSRLLRWDPPALTVAEALDAALTHPLPEPDGAPTPPAPDVDPVAPERIRIGDVVVRAAGLRASYGPLRGIRDLDLTVRAGEIVALTGANGSGKSTLLACLAGLHRPAAGTVEVAGQNPGHLRGRTRIGAVGLVPAEPTDLLLTDRVDRECASADDEADVPGGRTAFVLDALLPGISPIRRPHELSGGEQQALALAVVLARGPALILLDEPTRGLDYATKLRLSAMLGQFAGAGHAVVVATHDHELISTLASRVVTLTDGSVTGDAGLNDALRQGRVCTQVGQIMAPAQLYTVDDVRRELAG